MDDSFNILKGSPQTFSVLKSKEQQKRKKLDMTCVGLGCIDFTRARYTYRHFKEEERCGNRRTLEYGLPHRKGQKSEIPTFHRELGKGKVGVVFVREKGQVIKKGYHFQNKRLYAFYS